MRAFIEKLPKVELHLHLEGAIPLDALWTLVGKYGAREEVGGRAALEERFRFRDFPHFIETWIWKNGFIREYEDFTFIAEAVARDLADQKIHYVEAFYSPGDFARHGLDPQEITRAVRTGLNRVADRITVNLVADLIRDFGPEQGAIWLEQIADVRDQGVIGIGIGGSEQTYPPEPYRAVYERARQLGLRTSAHAGEAAGAESVWGAVRELGVDRIGHGTRAAEDPNLLDWLAEHRLPVEMCPISNLRTGVVSSIAAHPIRDFFDRGLLICVNTDDPKMFNNSLADELMALHRELGFQKADIVTLLENAIEAAWCDEPTRAGLMDELRQAASSGNG